MSVLAVFGKQKAKSLSSLKSGFRCVGLGQQFDFQVTGVQLSSLKQRFQGN